MLTLRTERRLFVLLSLLSTGLTWPLIFYASEFKADRIDPAHEPGILLSLAAATRDHPWAGFLVWLVFTTLVVLWLFKPSAEKPILAESDCREVQAEENVITRESPLQILWREASEGRYLSVKRVQQITSTSDKTLGELIVERRRRR